MIKTNDFDPNKFKDELEQIPTENDDKVDIEIREKLKLGIYNRVERRKISGPQTCRCTFCFKDISMKIIDEMKIFSICSECLEQDFIKIFIQNNSNNEKNK